MTATIFIKPELILKWRQCDSQFTCHSLN